MARPEPESFYFSLSFAVATACDREKYQKSIIETPDDMIVSVSRSELTGFIADTQPVWMHIVVMSHCLLSLTTSICRWPSWARR